ncbi:9191_t:CDS:2, partial [Funneliformis geosporum]
MERVLLYKAKIGEAKYVFTKERNGWGARPPTARYDWHDSSTRYGTFTVGTRKTARTSPFSIILTTRGFLVCELRLPAAF